MCYFYFVLINPGIGHKQSKLTTVTKESMEVTCYSSMDIKGAGKQLALTP